MAKKNDLKNNMSAGLTGGLDNLLQSTAGQKEACIVILSWTKPITRT